MSRRSPLRAVPNPFFQHVLDGGYRKSEPEHFAHGGSLDEIAVARISLKLHAEVGTRRTDVEAVRKRLYLKMFAHEPMGPDQADW